MLMSPFSLTRSISLSNLPGILSIAPVAAADTGTGTGSSVNTMQHRIRILSIRFFMLRYLRSNIVSSIYL